MYTSNGTIFIYIYVEPIFGTDLYWNTCSSLERNIEDVIISVILKNERYDIHTFSKNIYDYFSFVQESTRWLVTKGRYDDAEDSVEKIAAWNQKDKPDLSKIIQKAAKYAKQTDADTNYSIISLFKTWERAKVTIGLMFVW